MLKALKHGRYARTEKLIQGGADAGLLDWIRAQIVAGYQPQGERGRRTTEQLTREVYCSFVPGPKARRWPTQSSLWAMRWVKWRAGGLETEPRYAVQSLDSRVRSPFPLRGRRRLRGDPRELVFWVRARRDTVTLSLNRLLRLAEEAREEWGIGYISSLRPDGGSGGEVSEQPRPGELPGPEPGRAFQWGPSTPGPPGIHGTGFSEVVP
jgi:hypothetical protein